MAHFLMTNDVECFSFEHNRYEPPVAKRVLEQGLPRLLDLYDKHDVNYQPLKGQAFGATIFVATKPNFEFGDSGRAGSLP